MARKAAQPAPDVPLQLKATRQEASRQIRERISRGRELRGRSVQSPQAFQEVQQEFWTWSEFNEEMLRQLFTIPRCAEEYSSSVGIFTIGGRRSLEQEIEELHESIDSKLRRLSSVDERLELIPLSPEMLQAPRALRPRVPSETSKVFVVHGHDDAAREAVARYLSQLGLDPIILHEQASRGRTISEKLEEHGDVGFAVVLLTPDDVGGSTPEELSTRARQNVILELGYFLGRLGRERVCAIHRGSVELPSDYLGVVYVPYDNGGAWRLDLAKELKAAGFTVDLNDALG